MKKLSCWMFVLGLLVCLSATMLIQAQEDLSHEDIIAALMATTEPEIIQQHEAPDGSYSAQVTVYPCVDVGGQMNSYERLDLINPSTGDVHLLDEQVIYCEGLGGFGFSVLRWSLNSEFMYYTTEREGVPDGMAIGLVPPMYRLQVADLSTEYLGQAQFSPNGHLLAVWTQTQVSILSPDSTEVTVYELLPPDLFNTNIIWLPNSSGLIFVRAESYMMSARSSVTHIDLATMEQTILLDTGE